MLKKHIKATNIELTQTISAYVEKVLHSLEKFVEEEIEALAEVEVGKTTHHHNKGDIFRAEINLTIGDRLYRSVVTADNLYSAIDELKDEIVNEVVRAKRKNLHILRRGHVKVKEFLKGLRNRIK